MLPRASNETSITPEYLSPREASTLTGIPLKTLEAMRSKRIGPPYVKRGASVRYPVRELREWMQSQLVVMGGGQ